MLPQELSHLDNCTCLACAGRDGRLDPEDTTAMATGTGNGTAPGTLTQLADYLRVGYWSDAGTIPRRYNLENTGFNPNYGVLTYNVSGYSADSNGITDPRKFLVREAFKLYEAVLGIVFVETSSASADFLFQDNASGAYASSSGYGSGIARTVINVSASWSGGTSTYNDYTLQTILHEIGHGLGLGHQGLYNGSGAYASDADFANDSWQGSMMSYFSQTENSYVLADREFLQTPMSVDWMALQAIYGNQSYNGKTFGIQNAFTGDTTYGFNTTITSQVSDIWAKYASYANRTASTIIDAGGIDTIDFSGYSANQRFDLTVTTASSLTPTTMDIGGSRGNLTLALGTVIENAIGGSGNDTFIGNAASNLFWGNGGNDTFTDSPGADTYFGGAGSDRVNFLSAYSSYTFDLVGNFLQVISNAVVDLVDNSVEWLAFNNTVFSFDAIAATFATLPAANIVLATDNSGSVRGPLASNDATDDPSPKLTGTLDAALSAGQTLTVYRDGTVAGNAKVNGLNWSFTDSGLDSGTYSYKTAVVSGGQNGGLSNAFVIRVDRDAPTASVDAVVSPDTTPALTGSVDDPTASVSVTVAGKAYTAQNKGNGTWVLADNTLNPLAPGSYNVKVTATDTVGNSSSLLVPAALTVEDIQPNPNSPAVLEFGKLVIQQTTPGAWTYVSFSEAIENAVVTIGSVTSNGPDFILPRIRNVTDNGFELQLDELSYSDGITAAETVSWVAVAEGVHEIGGLTVAAGTTTGAKNQRWVTESLGSGFDTAPVVFTQVTSDLNPPALVTRIQAVKAESFQFQLQKEEAAGNTHASQPVNWVAFERGDGSAFDAARTAKVVTDADYDLSFDPVPLDEFVFLAAMQTRKGGDTAKVGLSDLSAGGATVFIEEEQSLDSETVHNAEIVAFLTASEGVWYS